MRVCRNWCYCSCHVAGYMCETESRYQILVDKYCSTISCYSVKWCACSLHRSNTTGNGVVFILFFYFLIFFFISDFKATHFVKENIHINFKWSTFFSKQSNCRWSFTWIAVNSLFLKIKSSTLTIKGQLVLVVLATVLMAILSPGKWSSFQNWINLVKRCFLHLQKHIFE